MSQPRSKGQPPRGAESKNLVLGLDYILTHVRHVNMKVFGIAMHFYRRLLNLQKVYISSLPFLYLLLSGQSTKSFILFPQRPTDLYYVVGPAFFDNVRKKGSK